VTDALNRSKDSRLNRKSYRNLHARSSRQDIFHTQADPIPSDGWECNNPVWTWTNTVRTGSTDEVRTSTRRLSSTPVVLGYSARPLPHGVEIGPAGGAPSGAGEPCLDQNISTTCHVLGSRTMGIPNEIRFSKTMVQISIQL